MSIRNQVVISSLAALLVVAALIVALVARARDKSEELVDQQFTDFMERGVAELRWLAVETALYHAPRSAEQWRIKHADIGRAIAAYPHRHADWNQLVTQIRESVVVLGTLYERLEGLPTGDLTPIDRELQARTVSSIMVVSHQLHDLIIRLVNDRRKVTSLRDAMSQRLIAGMLGILMVTLMMLVGVVLTRVLRPIAKLRHAMEIVARGNLSHRLNLQARGEVAELARSFDQMTSALENSSESLEAARRQSVDYSLSLERMNAFQRAVFDQAPDGILVADEKGRVVEANDRMATLFGWTRDALLERTVDDLVPDEECAAHLAHGRPFRAEESTRPMSPDRTLEGLRADGTRFPIEVAISPMRVANDVRVIAIVKDVTAARRAEQALRDALKEKELLLGEIHHRVKNNLQIVHSLLDMQVGLTTDASAAAALRDSQNRIQSMALIHQTLYQSQSFAKVDFGRFLETLSKHLYDSYGRRELAVVSRAPNVYLSIDTAIPCGLIVNELVTNALKHAFPAGRSGQISVEMRLLRGVDVEVVVSDDGVGLPADFDQNTASSLGMQLVQVLTEQLRAELAIRPRDPTRFNFVFPLERS